MRFWLSDKRSTNNDYDDYPKKGSENEKKNRTIYTTIYTIDFERRVLSSDKCSLMLYLQASIQAMGKRNKMSTQICLNFSLKTPFSEIKRNIFQFV